MTAPSDPYRELLVAIEPLGPDELRVLTALALRFAMGQRQYGKLDLLNDARDYLRERHEEVLDGAIYEASHAVRAHLLATAPTDPCPPPTPSTLGERMAQGGFVMSPRVETDEGVRVLDVPDAEPTERGT